MFVPTPRQQEAIYALGKYRHTMLFGGSQSGKTSIILRCLLVRAMRTKCNHLIVRNHLSTLISTIWMQTLPKIIELSGLEEIIHPNNQKYILTFKHNGSQIFFGGIDKKDRVERVLGNSLAGVYLNECSQISLEGFTTLRTRISQKIKDVNIRMWYDCNPPYKSHWTYKYFVQKKDEHNNALKYPDNYGYLQMNPNHNRDNLPGEYLEEMESLTGKYKQRFWDGEFLDETEGALFNQVWIDRNRSEYINYAQYKRYNTIIKTVVSIDIATTKNEESDETGIAVCSLLAKKREKFNMYAVLADLTVHKASPQEWARRAIQTVDDFEADAIVVETNQGGDLISAVLRECGYKGKIIEVHASRNKQSRAEPISALYELGLVEHLDNQNLAALELQMTSYVPFLTTDSPDRMDAVVWGLTYLKDDKSAGAFTPENTKSFMSQARRAGWS